MGQRAVLHNEIGRLGPLEELESRLSDNGCCHIVGVDEAGRGPLAGPVVAAAVILPQDEIIEGLDDSKKLSPTRRDILFDRIVASSAVYAVGIINNDIIDRVNILRATLRAMTEAITKLPFSPDVVLVDGNQTIPSLDLAQLAIVGGDAACQSISAASILAKVTRDRIMNHYAKLYLDFSFARHKGYPTAEHLRELKLYGPTPIHRRSFRPVSELVSQMEMMPAR